jgi:ATP-binding cassette subfamily C protein/ATP-binding cassette subfamily C protein EexD
LGAEAHVREPAWPQPPPSTPPPTPPLRRALRACRKQFLLVGVFSGAVNLLQLTTSIYMMQVFDRVLATRVLDTLLYLSLIAGAAGARPGAAGGGARPDHAARRLLGGEPGGAGGFVRAIESTLRGRPYRMEGPARPRGLPRLPRARPGALSVYDVPWVPIYIAVIFACTR